MRHPQDDRAQVHRAGALLGSRLSPIVIGIGLMFVVTFGQLVVYVLFALQSFADDRLLSTLGWGVLGPVAALLSGSLLASPIAWVVTAWDRPTSGR